MIEEKIVQLNNEINIAELELKKYLQKAVEKQETSQLASLLSWIARRF